jgi:hypothetical protein
MTQPIPQRHDRSACTGDFADGTPCLDAWQCDRYLRGLTATSPWQVWSTFEADESGERCDEFRALDPIPIKEAFAELRQRFGHCFAGKHFDSETREFVEDE